MKREHSIKRKIKYVLGGTALGHHYYQFLLVHTLFLVFTRIPGIFINTLLMNQTGSINSTLFYNGAIFAACAAMMLLSAHIMHRTQSKVTAVIGILGYNLLYLCYILFQDRVGQYYMLFGLANGMADGFYYISYGRMILSCTETWNRDSGMGIISIFSAAVNLLVPLFSGSLISLIGGVKGYVVVFIVAFLVAFATLLAVFRLPNEIRHREKPGVHYLKFLKLICQKRQILYGLLGETMKGVREGTFMFILNMILYQLVKNEFLIGCNSFLSGAASILCFWFMSHFIRPDNRQKYMVAAICILTGVSLISLWAVNPVMVVVFAVINAFFAGMIEISCYTTFFDISQSVPEAEQYTPELLAFHEVFVVVGRCAGLFAFAVINTIFHGALQAQLASLLLLTVFQFFTVLLCRKARVTAIRISI